MSDRNRDKNSHLFIQSPKLRYGRFLSYWLILISCTVAHPASGQSSDWTAHTSFRHVQAVESKSGQIWVATRGGIFNYIEETGELRQMTAVDGLHSVEVRALAIDDRRGVVWVGYTDGVLDRITVETDEVTTFRDIERAQQFSSRGIKRIIVRGDSIFVATEFGIVVFDPVQSEVRDSYTRLGDITAATPVFDITFGPDESGQMLIWAATMDGVAHAPLSGTNLQDPSSWGVSRAGLADPAREIRSLAFFNGQLYAGTAEDVYRRSETDTFSKLFVSSEASGNVTDLVVTADRLIGVDRFRFILVEQDGSKSIGVVSRYQEEGVYQALTGIASGMDGTYWMGDAESGLIAIAAPAAGQSPVTPLFEPIVPSGPYDTQFSDLDVDGDGNLWAGGVATSTSGFHRLGVDGEWTTYSGTAFPELVGRNRFTRIHVDAAGSAWAASEGDGLASVDVDGTVSVYDQTNSSLLEAEANFVIVGGVGSDSDDAVWVTTRNTSLPLHVRTKDGSWQGFGPSIGDGLTSRSTAYDRLYVDSFDQKWIVVRNENDLKLTRGLLVLDTGSTSSQQDDVFQFYGEEGGGGQGLPSVTVTHVTEDRDGLIWVATEGGPAYFVNTGIVASDPSARAIWPQWADRSLGTFMLFGLRINFIAVDPANRLWFATNEGAWLVQSVEGGYELVHHFTIENSPLFSNVVMSVAVDDRSGKVYFSTDRGLISFDGDAVAPATETRDLFIYPNPARLSDLTSPSIFIEGLVDETEIRILTASGSLVRRLSARGGRIRWDARDESGRLVSSGVYLVVAVGGGDQGTAYGKVAIIR